MALGAEKCSFLQYQDKEGGPMGFVFLVGVSGSWLCPSTELPPGVCSQRPLGPGLHRVATGTRGRVRECGHEEALVCTHARTALSPDPKPHNKQPPVTPALPQSPLCGRGDKLRSSSTGQSREEGANTQEGRRGRKPRRGLEE